MDHRAAMVNYDVFLNHRGPDVKGGFISHLHQALKSAGLNPFLDKKALEKGGHAQDDIDEALEGAEVHVVVVSKGYAQSRYCLNELASIMEMWVIGKTVIPVFYDVDPAHLRRVQKGPFAAAFLKHNNRETPEQVEEWVEALRDLADLTGFCLSDYRRDEAELTCHVVDEVKKCISRLSQQIFSANAEERRSYYQAPPAQSNSTIVDQGYGCRLGSNERSGPQQIIQNQTIIHGNVYIDLNHREHENLVEGMTSMRLREMAAPAYSAPAYPMLAPSGSRMQQSFVEEVEDSSDDESYAPEDSSDDESPQLGNYGGHNFSKPSVTFDLLPIDYQLPPGYRLATIQDVCDNRQAVCREMPGWEIAKLADGYVDGKLYGGRTGTRKRKDLGHKLVVS